MHASWRWRLGCAALTIPLAAILHQTIFFPQMCMLNTIGRDYTPDVVARWLARDPSLPLAALLAAGFYWLSSRQRWLRRLLVPFLIAFAPLSIWVWDIPFSGRAICAAFHDKQVALPGGGYLRNRHFYMLGVALFAALSIASCARSRLRSG